MKRIFALPLFLASCACFAQTQQGPTYTQTANEQIQAIREQALDETFPLGADVGIETFNLDWFLGMKKSLQSIKPIILQCFL